MISHLMIAHKEPLRACWLNSGEQTHKTHNIKRNKKFKAFFPITFWYCYLSIYNLSMAIVVRDDIYYIIVGEQWFSKFLSSGNLFHLSLSAQELLCAAEDFGAWCNVFSKNTVVHVEHWPSLFHSPENKVRVRSTFSLRELYLSLFTGSLRNAW